MLWVCGCIGVVGVVGDLRASSTPTLSLTEISLHDENW